MNKAFLQTCCATSPIVLILFCSIFIYTFYNAEIKFECTGYMCYDDEIVSNTDFGFTCSKNQCYCLATYTCKNKEMTYNKNYFIPSLISGTLVIVTLVFMCCTWITLCCFKNTSTKKTKAAQGLPVSTFTFNDDKL